MGLKAKIASLVVDLSANSASFNSELAKSKKNAGSWATDVKKHTKVAAAALAATGVAGAVALTKLTKASMVNIDALAKHADKIGMTSQALAGLRHQAELNGVANSALDMGMQRMVRRISEAAEGTGVASTALAELGLNAEYLNNLSPDKQFSSIADAMEDVANQSDKVRLGFKLFDSGGVGLINAMRGGSDAMAQAQKEADALGIAISRIDAAKIEAANDAVLRSDRVWTGLGNTLAIEVSPFIAAIKTDFTESAIANNGFRDQVVTGMEVVSKAVGFVANTVRGLEVGFKSLQIVTAHAINGWVDLLASVASIIPKIDESTPIIGEHAKAINSFLEGAELAAKVSKSRVSELTAELHALAMKKLPSDNVDEYFGKIKSQAQEAAEQVVRSNKEIKSEAVVPEGINQEASKRIAAESKLTQFLIAEWEGRGRAEKKISAEKIAGYKALSLAEGQYYNLLSEYGSKKSQLYKASLVAQKAAAIPKMIVSTEEGAASALTLGPIAGPIAAGAVKALGYASIGVVAGQTISGIAHGGIDEIPEESTWLLQKGERVLSPNQNIEVQKAAEKINATPGIVNQNLPNTSPNYSSAPKTAANDENRRAGGVVVNIHEDASRSGQVEHETSLTAEDVINIYVSNVTQGGEAAQVKEQIYGLERVGR